jgi:hypothetical protein
MEESTGLRPLGHCNYPMKILSAIYSSLNDALSDTDCEVLKGRVVVINRKCVEGTGRKQKSKMRISGVRGGIFEPGTPQI